MEPTPNYRPQPLDTSGVVLPDDIQNLIERLAENTHDIWAASRLREGWTYGPTRNDAARKHPCLVAYHDLPESEKDYDRRTASEALKAIVALGYRISK